MGRRKPQQDVQRQMAELRQEGMEPPFFGLPAESGGEICFAPGLIPRVAVKLEKLTPEESAAMPPVSEGRAIELPLESFVASVVDDEDPEWKVMYSRLVGNRLLTHVKSSKTGRAHLLKSRNPQHELRDTRTRFSLAYHTMQANATAHTVRAERQAQKLLRKNVSSEQWRSYVLSGMFYEVSRRSHLIYVFRRGAPTIVAQLRARQNGMYLEPMVTLCMHPVGYTADSSAGCLCPSDDVIAHVLLMRTNEHRYWRTCTQHTLDEPQSML